MISFSKQVKEELLYKSVKESNPEIIRVALCSIIHSSGTLIREGQDTYLEIKSINSFLIRDVLVKIKKYGDYQPRVIIRQNKNFKKDMKVFIIRISYRVEEFLYKLNLIENKTIPFLIEFKFPRFIKESFEFIQTYLKYAFIVSGSINNPKIQKQYHLEIVNFSHEYCIELIKMTKKYYINFKETKRNNICAVYLNKSEEIADFLKLIGAVNSLFEFENFRLTRDIRVTENRLINAEIANETKKQIKSNKQIEAILYLKTNNIMRKLKPKTQYIAQFRLENPEVSLADLSRLSDGKYSKSNLRYHLNIMEKMYENIKENE